MTTLLQSCTSFNAAPVGNASFDVTTVTELSKDGGVTEKTFPGQFDSVPLIIIRESETKYLAFCTVCTHYGKKVSAPANSTSDIICNAHNGHFSPKDGHVISGPPKSGLTRYNCSFNTETNILTITG
ncbi:MAG: Rieske (2Fe-2S) protein [Candidatus Kapabacteria bacterium]|nr:Rieske (2Fe-2S) protein [Candidatus Kapabacteria bacterium]